MQQLQPQALPQVLPQVLPQPLPQPLPQTNLPPTEPTEPETPRPRSPRPHMDPRLSASILTTAGTGAAFALVGAAVFSLRVGASIGIGAAIAAANLYVLARIIAAAFAPPPREEGVSDVETQRSARRWIPFGFLKAIFLFGGVWVCLSLHVVELFPFFVGLGALPIGIAIGSLVGDRSASQGGPRS